MMVPLSLLGICFISYTGMERISPLITHINRMEFPVSIHFEFKGCLVVHVSFNFIQILKDHYVSKQYKA